jgi:hypothetical protein
MIVMMVILPQLMDVSQTAQLEQVGHAQEVLIKLQAVALKSAVIHTITSMN